MPDTVLIKLHGGPLDGEFTTVTRDATHDWGDSPYPWGSYPAGGDYHHVYVARASVDQPVLETELTFHYCGKLKLPRGVPGAPAKLLG
jgi:hypothetical protein